MSVEDLAAKVEALTTAYAPATALYAAVELAVFDALPADTWVPLDDLARRIGGTPDGTARLVRGLVALGDLGVPVVDYDVALGRVRALPEAIAVLSRAGAHSRVDYVHHHHRQLLPPLLELAAAVRTGQPQHAAWDFGGAASSAPLAATPYDELARHPREQQALVAALDVDARGVGTKLARALPPGTQLVVDVGCGGGAIARELLAALPAVRVASFDQGAAVDAARAASEAAGLADRHVVAAHDARAPLPAWVSGADAVVLSAILADFPAAERAAILAHTHAALRPGGVVVVAETLLEADRTSPPKAALLSLLTLAITRGDQFTADDLAGELAAAGFVDITPVRGAPRDLVIGHKGAA